MSSGLWPVRNAGRGRGAGPRPALAFFHTFSVRGISFSLSGPFSTKARDKLKLIPPQVQRKRCVGGESVPSVTPHASSYPRAVSLPAGSARCYSASHPGSTGCRTASATPTGRAAPAGPHTVPRRTSSTALSAGTGLRYQASCYKQQKFPQNSQASQPRLSSSCRLAGGFSGRVRMPKKRWEMISSFSHKTRSFICCPRNLAAK